MASMITSPNGSSFAVCTSRSSPDSTRGTSDRAPAKIKRSPRLISAFRFRPATYSSCDGWAASPTMMKRLCGIAPATRLAISRNRSGCFHGASQPISPMRSSFSPIPNSSRNACRSDRFGANRDRSSPSGTAVTLRRDQAGKGAATAPEIATIRVAIQPIKLR